MHFPPLSLSAQKKRYLFILPNWAHQVQLQKNIFFMTKDIKMLFSYFNRKKEYHGKSALKKPPFIEGSLRG
ncbi:hypothetical protein AM592_09755 [Bacillus gobiensis]|uniref:Uncharacterized protein n=1 Tax=Bacillus gobiensis TaxID=1441095 RepID=A0A0M3R9Q9_9BACI|nr:hypothetical protein AM592_09755 [Bacillus gobiensis]